MKIAEVKPNQGNIDLTAEVVLKEEERTFEKFGKKGRVCNVKVKDDSGEIVLTLWNDDIDKVSEGDTVHLQNGWCSEYKSQRQLSTGKFGKIEVVGENKQVKVAPKSASSAAAKAAKKPQHEQQQAVFTNDPEQLNSEEENSEESMGEEELIDDEY